MMRSAENPPFPYDQMRELLVGTWTGVALISEILIQQGAVERDDLVSVLSAAEGLARDRRRIALAALRRLIEDGFTKPKARPHCRHGLPRD